MRMEVGDLCGEKGGGRGGDVLLVGIADFLLG